MLTMAPQEIPLATPSTSNGFDISSSSNGGTEVGLEFGFGIVYHIQTPQQFWNEIEDVLSVTHSSSVSLAVLDNALKTFITLCAEHHELFLQTKAQLDHAIGLLLDCELFTFHSERSTDIVLEHAKANTDPHHLLILYKVLLHYGLRVPPFFRALKKWQPLLPLLMDHVRVDVDESISGGIMGLGIPIESRLRVLSVTILYEVCRVQKIDASDLKLFTDGFINHLFDLVEQTRNNPDESVNYALIKLIVALNEQFMVSALPSTSSPIQSHRSSSPRTSSPVPRTKSPAPPPPPTKPARTKSPLPPSATSNSAIPANNKVLQVLIRRAGDSKTFGENLIFMLNRAEDLCMQLLVLKLLYLLFTTKATQEYFYTNDLRVLVDVFIRELADLPEESESLKHTYLRVLHPLLNNTQLKDHPYKRLQVRNMLQSLIAHGHIRDISPTMYRLVDRCLKGSWCIGLEKEEKERLEAAASSSKVQPDAGKTKSVLGIQHHRDLHSHSPNIGASSSSSMLSPPANSKTIHRSASMDMLSLVGGQGNLNKGCTSTNSATKSGGGGFLASKEVCSQQPRDLGADGSDALGLGVIPPTPQMGSFDIAKLHPPPPPSRSLAFPSIATLTIEEEGGPVTNHSSTSLVSVTAATPVSPATTTLSVAANSRPRASSVAGMEKSHCAPEPYPPKEECAPVPYPTVFPRRDSTASIGSSIVRTSSPLTHHVVLASDDVGPSSRWETRASSMDEIVQARSNGSSTNGSPPVTKRRTPPAPPPGKQRRKAPAIPTTAKKSNTGLMV
ncbi:hypothetical protein FRC03_000186 [Tulasnella sp. 419]|nr:hypothetical protein FRC03_000186 [Tulasnella sp. 419]